MPPSENSDIGSSQWTNQALQQRNQILKMLTDRHPNVTIKVGNRSYVLNKTLLSSFSPYFNAMFNRPFLESKLSVVKLREVEPQPFEVLLAFMSGNDPGACCKDDSVLLEAVDLADRFCFDLFLGYYDEELDSNFESYHLSLAFRLCERLGKNVQIEHILNKVHDCLLTTHYRTLKNESDERIYDEMNYELLCSVITGPKQNERYLNPDSPCTCSLSEKFLDGVLHWVVYKPKERFPCLKNLLGILQVREMPQCALFDTVIRVAGPELPLCFRKDLDLVIRDALK